MVARGETFDSKIPVVLTDVNDCLGVKNEGGILDHKTLELEIRCRPSKLPENILVDVSELNVGDAIHVDDLEAIEDVEFLNTGIQVIVSCQPPTVAVVADEPETTEETEEAADIVANEVKEAKIKRVKRVQRARHFSHLSLNTEL